MNETAELLRKMKNIQYEDEQIEWFSKADCLLNMFLANATELKSPQKSIMQKMFVTYAFRFARYIKEIGQSIETIHLLGINAICRSAIESYSLAKYCFCYRNKNCNIAMQKILYSDLKQIDRTIKGYEELCISRRCHQEIRTELSIHNNNFLFQVDAYFPLQKVVDSSMNIDRQNTLNSIYNKIKNASANVKYHNNDFTNNGLQLSNLVKNSLKNNKVNLGFCKANSEYSVEYPLMCSNSHSIFSCSFNSILDNGKVNPSLYPTTDDESNKKRLLNILYCCFMDLLECVF